MLQTSQILVSVQRPAACIGIAAIALTLCACGQPGALYLPTEPAAARRATLPQSLWPVMPPKTEQPSNAPGSSKATTPPAPAAPNATNNSAPSSTEKSPQP